MADIFWNIRDLERHIETGVVTKVYFKCTAVDGDINVSYQDMVYIYQNKVENRIKYDFIPFEELTEEQLIEWTLEYLGEYLREKIKSDLLASIEMQKNMKEYTKGLPWK